MSTRSQLYVRGSDVVLYRHSDGYPEGECGVLACILPFLKRFHAHRPSDPYYCSAQLLGHIIADFHADNERMVRRKKRDSKKRDWKFDAKDEEEYRGFRYLGHGVEAFDPQKPVLHGDIEYFYVVDTEKQLVEVRAPLDARQVWGVNVSEGDIYCNCVLLKTFKFGAKPPLSKTNSLKRTFLKRYAKEHAAEQTPAAATV